MASGCTCDRLAGDLDLAPICLGHHWVFADLPPEDLKALMAAARRRRYEEGEVIFRQGDPAETMFLIKGGRVRLYKVSEDGAELTLDIRQAGDFLGENLLNDRGGELPVTAQCLETTLTCGFSQAGFEGVVMKHPGIGLQVIKNLSRRIDWLFSRVGSLSLTNLEERLHSVLVQVAREHGSPAEGGWVLPIPFTHQELSFLVGAHRVSITRAMKGLRESGRVRQEGRTLIIPEPPH